MLLSEYFRGHWLCSSCPRFLGPQRAYRFQGSPKSGPWHLSFFSLILHREINRITREYDSMRSKSSWNKLEIQIQGIDCVTFSKAKMWKVKNFRQSRIDFKMKSMCDWKKFFTFHVFTLEKVTQSILWSELMCFSDDAAIFLLTDAVSSLFFM